ncbi:ribosomal protein L10-domain-containing protein [Amanita rubescens]|nr:ribosomal protein L10-domain-containing protein [Amanita rubescens]
MPKSKRSKVVSLTKVSKKTREHKNALLEEVKNNVDKWQYCWLLEVGNMRNTHLKTVRKLWKDSARIIFGRGAVMAKALGTSPEEEHKLGIHQLAQNIKGQVGLLFTDTSPQEVIEWFIDFKQPDFARSGNIATRTVVLPAGPIMRRHSDPPEPFPHNEEPQLRKLGLSTYMNKGVPSLYNSHQICQEGKPLTGEQAQLLKLIGEKMIEFKVGLVMRYDSETSTIEKIEGARISDEVGEEKEGDGMSE